MAVLYSNNASSALSASITSTATSFSVTANHGVKFPAISGGDYFYVTLLSTGGAIEIVKVTARSVDTFTVVRGQDGTTGTAFAAGDKVEARITKALLDDFKTDTRFGYLPLSGGTTTGSVRLGGGTSNPASTAFAHTIAGNFRVVNFDGLGSRPSVWWTNGSRALFAIDALDAAGASFWANDGTNWQQQMTVNYGFVNVNTVLQQGGNQVLHAGNYTSYSPSLGGSGASGAWGISVTGSAGSTPLLSALGNYVWSASTLPTGFNQGIQCSFVYSGWQNYGSVMTMNTYSGGGGALQMYVPYSPTYGGTGLQVRFGNYDVANGNAWTGWKTLLASDNYSNYALPLTGGNLTTGASSNLFIGRNSTATNYNAISLNGNSADSSNMGLTGGGVGDITLYINSPGSISVRTNSFGNSFSFSGSSFSAPGAITSGGNTGFRNNVYFSGVRNPIWSFGDATSYGISYFQGGAGIGGADTIGIHPNGTATSGGSAFSVTPSASYVNSNVVLHAGNINSYIPTWSTGVNGNHLVQRDSNGYIYANHINFSTGEAENPTINSFITSNGDGWSRKSSKAHVINQLGLITTSNISSQSVNYSSYSTYLSTNYVGGQQLNPQTYFSNGVGLKVAMTAAAGVWSDTLWINGYNGGDVLQMCALHFQRNGTPRMYISNQASTATSYGTLYEVLTSYNYTSYAGGVSATNTWTGYNYFQSNLGGYLGSLANAPLQAYCTGGNSAFMSFHRSGNYAVNMGLDADNVFRIGGWSASANRLQMDMSGNLTMAGNVTAFSDERLKKDWSDLPSNFVMRLAAVKHGTYTRIDSGERQAGSSAQEWQTLLPEVVSESPSDDKTLSLAYGNAALVSAIELAKDNVELRARIERLEALVEKLIRD